MDRAGLIVTPQPQNDGDFVSAQLVKAVVTALLIVCGDQVQSILADAVLLGTLPGFLHQHASLDQNVRLALNIPVIGVSE